MHCFLMIEGFIGVKYDNAKRQEKMGWKHEQTVAVRLEVRTLRVHKRKCDKNKLDRPR